MVGQRRADFALIGSQLVIDEAARVDVHAAALRLEILAGIPMVVIDESAQDLAAKLLQHGALPSKAAAALHIAIATLADADFLLTWNWHAYRKRSFTRLQQTEAKNIDSIEPAASCIQASAA